MAAPRSQIRDGGPCDAFGYTSEGESIECGVVLLYIQRVSKASYVSNKHRSGGVYIEDFLEGSV